MLKVKTSLQEMNVSQCLVEAPLCVCLSLATLGDQFQTLEQLIGDLLSKWGNKLCPLSKWFKLQLR